MHHKFFINNYPCFRDISSNLFMNFFQKKRFRTDSYKFLINYYCNPVFDFNQYLILLTCDIRYQWIAGGLTFGNKLRVHFGKIFYQRNFGFHVKR
jgi:hypothetical protein